MSALTERERQAVASSIVTLIALANHSLSPTQTKMATRAAGELLWVMGIDSFEAGGRVFKAAPPLGETIDLQSIPLIERSRAAGSGA